MRPKRYKPYNTSLREDQIYALQSSSEVLELPASAIIREALDQWFKSHEINDAKIKAYHKAKKDLNICMTVKNI